MSLSIAVNLERHNPDWLTIGSEIGARLVVLKETLIVVHHIGSTAILGLAAKPVIDLMPIVTDLGELDLKQGIVESLGYAWHGEFGVEGRRFCTLSHADGERVAQLHFYDAHSLNARRQLAFRDYLRAFPDCAADYETEKRRARELYPDDSHAYSAEKGAWIRTIEAKALDWFVGDVSAP